MIRNKVDRLDENKSSSVSMNDQQSGKGRSKLSPSKQSPFGNEMQCKRVQPVS